MTNTVRLRVSIAQVIRELMAAQNRSANSLANAAGISEPTLRRRLAGGFPFTTDELGAIGELLGCEVDDLIRRARTGMDRAA